MRLGIVSDVHADVHALQDALVQIARLRCDEVVCAGDLVDYGLFPEETLALLRERPVACIRGNHDRWAIGRGRADDPSAAAIGEAHDASGWDLSAESLQFLAQLPTAWDRVLDGVRVAVRHGTPASDMQGVYPDQTDPEQVFRWLEQSAADVLIVGHTHLAFELRTFAGGMIINPGALLRQAAKSLTKTCSTTPTAERFRPRPCPAVARSAF